MTHQIGILFWGCKGGHRNFCDNGVIDVYSNEIRQTYKDIRSFATFSVVNTDFYALEFTRDYKVYTHYRSSNDSGSGAFIALTIYVPHNLQVTGIRPIMDKMMDEYFAQYFNPITNSPIPGMIDDIAPFQQMFEEYTADKIKEISSRFRKCPSRQDDTPKVFAYSSLEEVDGYFMEPYHPEFFNCQEVMFISKDILQNPADYGLRFLVQPVFIDTITPPEPEPYINKFPQSNDFRLTMFKVNGIDHTAAQGDVALYPEDRISMCIEGDSKLHRPIDFENVLLEEVIQRGLIRKVDGGKRYEFLPVYNLDYADFNVNAHISGDDSGTIYRCFALRSMDDPRVFAQGAIFDPKSGMFAFPVNGRFLNHRFQLIYSLMPTFAIQSLIIEMKQVDVNMLIDQNQILDLAVNKYVINLVFPARAPQSLQFKITSSDKTKSINGTITQPSSRMDIYLPSDFTITPNDVEFSAPGYKCCLDEKTRFVIYPEMVDVEVEIPRLLQSFNMGGFIPTYQIEDKIYKGVWEKNKCYIRLPFEWVDLKGKLIIDGNVFQLEENSGNNKISFKCAIVHNKTNKSIGYDVFFEDNKRLSQKLAPGNLKVYPANIDVRLAPGYDSEAVVEEIGYGTDSRTKTFSISLRNMAPSALPGIGRTSSAQENALNDRRPGGEFTHPRDNNQGNNEHSDFNPKPNIGGYGNQGYQGGIAPTGNTNTTSNDDRAGQNIRPVAPNYGIKLNNCDTFYARVLQDNNQYSLVPIANLDTTNFRKVNPEIGQVKLLDSHEKEVCVVNFPQSQYRRDTFIADRNTQNGFEVSWVDEYHCIVTYKKNNYIRKILNSFNSNKKLYLGVISILIIALITALCMFFMRTSEDYSLDLRFAEVHNSETSIPVKAIGFKDLVYEGDAFVMSNNGDILNVKGQTTPFGDPSKGGDFSDLYVVYTIEDTIRIVKNEMYNDPSFLVIYPEDIKISQIVTEADSLNKDEKSAEAKSEWTLETIYALLAKPSLIDHNMVLSVELPPLDYLKRYQEILAMAEIDELVIDTLAIDYPQYISRITRLKEPRPARVENPASGGEAANVAPETKPEKGKETPTKEDPKPAKDAKDSKETKTDKPTTPAAPADPNAAVKAEYQKMIAGLNGAEFDKKTVDGIVDFRDKNKKQLGDEVTKNNAKLIAYWNFVHGKDFEIKQMTQEQQNAIEFAKKFAPQLYKERNFAKIYNAYTEAGGGSKIETEDVIDGYFD